MRNEKTEHTPTPWRIATFTNDCRVSGQDGIGIAVTNGVSPRRDNYAENKANSALIVRAVNAHDELVAALVQAIESEGFGISGPTDHRAAEDGEPVWVCNARAALAKAGE